MEATCPGRLSAGRWSVGPQYLPAYSSRARAVTALMNSVMYVLPQAYRVKREPSSPYDSMIFVPYAHPTEIWPRP